jgi:hypothetical protein
MRITSTGNVGIGTSSPLTKFEVRSGVITVGTSNSPTGTELLRGYYGSSGALAVIGTEYSSGGPVIGYGVKPSTSTIGAFLSSTLEPASRGAYTIAGNTHKWYIGASQTVAENSSVSTSEVMRITSAGNVGIGTSSPSQLLHVAGNIFTTGSISVEATTASIFTSSPGVTTFRQITDTSGALLSVDGSWPIRFNTSGTERVRIDSNGRLGVGTSSPWSLMSVGNSGTVGDVTSARQISVGLSTNYNVSLGYYQTGVASQFAGVIQAIDGAVGTPLLLNPSGGRVGIGTSSPVNSLQVTASAFAAVPSSGSSGHCLAVGSSTYGLAGGALTNGNVYLQVTRWDSFAINYDLLLQPNGGRVGIGTSNITGTNTKLEVAGAGPTELKISDTSTYNPQFRGITFGLTGDATTYSAIRFQPNSGELRYEAGFATWGGYHTFYTNGLERLRIDNTGNIGIGTSSPSTKLHVYGGDLKIQKGPSYGDVSELTFENAQRTGRILSGYTNYVGITETYLAFHTNWTGQFNNTVGESMRLAGNRLGIGTAAPDALLEVKSVVTGTPATSGTTQTTGVLRLSSNATSGVLDFGTNSANPWIQSTDRADLSQKYNLLLNPNGGSVGIGVSSPVGRLSVASTTQNVGFNTGTISTPVAGNIFYGTDDTGWQLRIGKRNNASGTFTPQMTFDDSGRIGISTIVPRSLLDLGAGSTGGNQISWHDGATTSYGNIWQSYNGARTVIGNGLKGSTTVVNGFESSTSNLWGRAAVELDYGSIKFYTNSPTTVSYGTAITPTERMKINDAGQVFIGASFYGAAGTSFGSVGTQVLNNNNSVDTGVSLWILSSRAADTGRQFLYFQANVAVTPTLVFQVMNNGNTQNANGSFTSISDARLKENIVDANSQWNDIKAIKIRNWNFKAETGLETHRQIGPVAQELELVCPSLVSETFDRDADGNNLETATKGVNQSVLYMKAVKALQEAMERIETLEARLTAAGIA